MCPAGTKVTLGSYTLEVYLLQTAVFDPQSCSSGPDCVYTKANRQGMLKGFVFGNVTLQYARAGCEMVRTGLIFQTDATQPTNHLPESARDRM